jgi:hypothetical protein
MPGAVVLIYHMAAQRQAALQGLCFSMGIRALPVPDWMARCSIGALSGVPDHAQDLSELVKGPAAIDEEMIVMAGFTEDLFNSFLAELRDMSLRIELKAVQTETNLKWSGEMLQAELKREREIFRKMTENRL